jgi:NodT family efflux transporter outer membrane factor (OMF) lipoprotein
MSRRIARLGMIIGVLALAGCEVGPRYVAPGAAPDAAQSFVSATPDVAASGQTLPPDWWRLYDDPVLNRLVPEALAENADLKTAAANLAYAQGLVDEARAGLFPTTDLSAGPTYGRISTVGLGSSASGVAARPQWSYGAGFSAAYQLDLFGRIRRGIEAASANAGAAEDAENVVRVTVAAETAGAYANVCAYAEQGAVARHSLSVLQQSYDILVRERSLGAISDLDVEREATLLEQTRATIPTIDGQRRAALFELAALLGRTPAEVPADAAACTTPPKIEQALPVGDGAALLRRRPDVREAERNVAAATARIGIATADLYPTISLTGAVNSAAGSIGGLGSSNAISYALGPLLTWSFPNILVARAHIRQTTAQTSAAIASFDSTVLTALRDTEISLTTYGGELSRHAALASASDHANQAFALAQTQYNAGSTSFLDLLTAETTLVIADQQLAASSQALAADQVGVFQQLGGGWEQAPVVIPPPVPGGQAVR